jgi:hypothetical protein
MMNVREHLGNQEDGHVHGAASAMLSVAQAARGDPPFKGHHLLDWPSPHLLPPTPVPRPAVRPVTLHSPPRLIPRGARAGLRGNVSS